MSSLGLLLLVTILPIYIILGILYESFIHPFMFALNRSVKNFGESKIKMWVNFKKFSLLTPLLGLSSCCFFSDPSYTRDVPPLPSEPWVPASKPLYTLCCSASSCGYIDLNSLALRGSLSLSALIDIALTNNPRTQRSWALARAAAFNWKATRSAYYPTIDGSVDYSLQKLKFGGGQYSEIDASLADPTGVPINVSPSSGRTAAANNSQFQELVTQELMISYLLLDFGGRDAEVEATRQQLIAADWMHNQVLQDVIVNVMRTYYTYLQNLALIHAKEEQLKDATTSSNAAEEQFEAGVATKVDYLLAKTNLVNVQLQLDELKGNLSINMGLIATAIGYKASTPLNLQDIPPDLKLKEITETAEELINIALLERPDLAAAYADYFANEQRIIAARSAGLPTLSTLGNIQKVNNVHQPSNNSQLYSGTISLDVPIFAGFLYLNREREAIENARASIAAIEELQNSISNDVVNSFYNLKVAIETFHNAEQVAAFAKEAYEAASLNYRMGIGSILDLLTAQTSLANARAQLINAKAHWLISLANLAYATGTLL